MLVSGRVLFFHQGSRWSGGSEYPRCESTHKKGSLQRGKRLRKRPLEIEMGMVSQKIGDPEMQMVFQNQTFYVTFVSTSFWDTHPTRICVEHVRNICIWSVSSIIWDRFLVMFTSLLLHTPHPMGIRRWRSRAAATAARAGRSAGGSRGTGGGGGGGDGMREMAKVTWVVFFFFENDFFEFQL